MGELGGSESLYRRKVGKGDGWGGVSVLLRY
jgi:hypothetical protein